MARHARQSVEAECESRRDNVQDRGGSTNGCASAHLRHRHRGRQDQLASTAQTKGNRFGHDTVYHNLSKLHWPGWTPLLATPVFQEYPSGHSGVSSAAATILASSFGNATAFSVTSAGVPGVERSFTSFSDAVAEVNDARVFAGIHFRFACEDANQVGTNVADFVNQTMFLRVHDAEPR